MKSLGGWKRIYFDDDDAIRAATWNDTIEDVLWLNPSFFEGQQYECFVNLVIALVKQVIRADTFPEARG